MTLDAKGLRRFRIDREAVRRFVADGLALFGSLALLGLYILPLVFRPTIFVPVPNAFFVSSTIVVFGIGFAGWSVFQRTAFDSVFFIWAVLAAASHIYAVSVLDRQLSEVWLYIHLVFVLTMWMSYRAGFAIVKVSPTFGPIALLVALLFTLLCSATLGILQAVGPVRVAAVELGLKFSGSVANVLEGATYGRPTGVFGGPNILGYANVVGSLCLAAIGTAYARVAKPLHVFLIMGGLGVFGYSTLLSQSRISLAVYVLIVLLYGLALRRYGAPRSALGAYVALLFAVGVVGMSAFQLAKLSYVEGTFQNDITKDSSLLVRQEALKMAGDIAVEIAPLGTGVGQVNQESLLIKRGYDRYWTIGVDNEWVNIYLAHGVWGPVFLAVFFVLAFRATSRARHSLLAAGRLIGIVATTLLVANFILGFTGVRIAKYDTGIYLTVILGAAVAAAGQPSRRPIHRPAA